MLCLSNGARRNAHVDFFDIKADVETLLELTGAAEEFSRLARDTLMPSSRPHCADISHQQTGWLDRRVASRVDARTRLYICTGVVRTRTDGSM